MTQFLAVYTGNTQDPAAARWDDMTPAEREGMQMQGMRAWGEWMATNSDRIVLVGGPLGRTKRASRQGISDSTNNLVGFVVIEAGSHAAAAELFENHPHFSIFPGEAVEIMECLPVPSV